MANAEIFRAQLDRIRTERAYEAVARQLRDMLLSARLRPGDKLPNERQLIESLGVSRGAVRQALLLLQQQGLVEVRVGQTGGVFVKEIGLAPVLNAFENLVHAQGITVAEYLAAKRALEPALTEGAVENITPGQLDALRANVRAMRDALAEDPDAEPDLLEFSLEFHEIVVSATGNRVLEALLHALIRLADRLPDFHSADTQDWQAVIDGHQAMIHALEHRDAEQLRRLMRDHVDSVESIFDPAASPAPARPPIAT
jgi:DNA-binding FadR family transcriptional regulator